MRPPDKSAGMTPDRHPPQVSRVRPSPSSTHGCGQTDRNRTPRSATARRGPGNRCEGTPAGPALPGTSGSSADRPEPTDGRYPSRRCERHPGPGQGRGVDPALAMTAAVPAPEPTPGGARSVAGRIRGFLADPGQLLAIVLLGALVVRAIWLWLPEGSLIFDEAYYVNAARDAAWLGGPGRRALRRLTGRSRPEHGAPTAGQGAHGALDARLRGRRPRLAPAEPHRRDGRARGRLRDRPGDRRDRPPRRPRRRLPGASRT